MLTPEAIVETLDRLELAADSPAALKLVGDLKWMIAEWAVAQRARDLELAQLAATIQEQTQEIRDLLARLDQVPA